jgi:hypothetical protein
MSSDELFSFEYLLNGVPQSEERRPQFRVCDFREAIAPDDACDTYCQNADLSSFEKFYAGR